ncbi:MAG: uracil-DNA glycosylase, partial [Opitutae bacterium]|nr:uracil-DNA glycosylase [Opitutae bacterium]
MDTREQLLALTDELRRRKAAGARTVTVADETLARLRASVRTQLAPASPPSPAAEVFEAPRPVVPPPPAAAAPRAAAPALPPPPALALP